MRDKHRSEKQKKFCELYAEFGVISEAARGTGIDRSTVYHWKEDEDFAEMFDKAQSDFNDSLERELFKRAHDSERNDTALIFALKGNIAEKYGDKHQIELSGKNDKPIEVSMITPRPEE